MSAQPDPLNDEMCAVCGHVIERRGLGTLRHDGLTYCSRACYERRGDRRAVALERAILGLLAERTRGVPVSPSDVARQVAGEANGDWGDLLEPVQDAARRLVADGLVGITAQGEIVDVSGGPADPRPHAIHQ